MEALAELSKAFEDRAGTVAVNAMTPQEVVRYLMDECGINTEGVMQNGCDYHLLDLTASAN